MKNGGGHIRPTLKWHSMGGQNRAEKIFEERMVEKYSELTKRPKTQI